VAEFALASTVFFLLLFAILDFGRAIYIYNGVSQAAREIARTTSVHPGTLTLGNSLETAETIAVQRNLVPGLSASPTFECVDDTGTAYPSGYQCVSGQDYVKVTVAAPWSPVAPLLNFLGSFNLQSSSSMRLS
jgi:Flp pilus assembly protein TadG